ncbi:hydantoinase/oxoprolinase family protein [Wenzhouxiangella sp. XN79A]|uniref:hydantoinase/oxoprolinase family protein n=1 Tax=Wenzhouxiangella sp. XN79A TaxID=2724193 RepID=UPI00144AF793|nr:hydantoinase/oxoprolinase family protein [Wenzhouxiangella sp. XN79A]
MTGPSRPRTRVGCDTGGTFTDFVALIDGRLTTAKVLSTPDDPARAILEGLEQLGLAPDAVDLVHGTTVGTNAVLEDRGAPVAFVTGTGFSDLLALGRQNRDALYALDQPPVDPPVPPDRCFEIDARTAADGRRLATPTPEALDRLKRAIAASGAEAVAINLLFSWLDPELEQQLADALADSLPVSCSHQVLPEIREYERGIATWLNAAIGPRLAGYLKRLDRALAGGRLAVMQSSSQTISADQAARRAVHLLLSGPAGGLAAAAQIGNGLGEDRLLTFDMGGTSTDVALLEGRPQLTREGRIGRYPVAVPMVDLHTIGAGGGSIARIDAGGLIQVGPQSAGADPGPACYGRGGTEVTVTDANLLLGRLPAGVKLGGRHALDLGAARAAMQRLADRAELDLETAARGVLRIANEHMSRALRVMSAERGVNPSNCTLASFGGAGGLHVCDLAESLAMRRALVPARSGVLSALGMLVAEPGRQLTASLLAAADAIDVDRLDAAFAPLEIQARDELGAEGIDADRLTLERRVACRYRGQSDALELPADAPDALIDAFHAAHEAAFGHRLALPVELVSVRLDARGPARLSRVPAPDDRFEVPASDGPVPLHARDALHDAGVAGPAIVLDADATTWVAEGWTARRTPDGHLLLER